MSVLLQKQREKFSKAFAKRRQQHTKDFAHHECCSVLDEMLAAFGRGWTFDPDVSRPFEVPFLAILCRIQVCINFTSVEGHGVYGGVHMQWFHYSWKRKEGRQIVSHYQR